MADKTKQGAAAPGSGSISKTRGKRPGYFGCLLGIILGLLGLAGSRLGHLWLAFDVFSQFTVQFGFMVLAFCIGLFMPRAKTLVASVVLIALMLALSVWPYYASSHPAILGKVTANERELKIASFNTWYENKDVNAVVNEAERIDADVLVLIEIGPFKQPLFNQLKQRYPYQARCEDTSECDFAVMSKYPLSNIESQLSWVGPSFVRVTLGPEFGGLTVFGVHTTRFPYSRAQYRQIKAMAGVLEKVVGPHVIVGDFNATPFSRVTQTLAHENGLVRLTTLPTWPARLGLPQVAIDHIFISPGIRQLESESIGNNAGSDHFPIFMKLAISIK